MITPQSSTNTSFSMVGLPVSRSILTSAAWAPKAHASRLGSKKAVSCRPGSMPAGSRPPWAAAAIWRQVTFFSGTPVTANPPSVWTISSGAASTKCAPMRRAFSITRSAAGLDECRHSHSYQCPALARLVPIANDLLVIGYSQRLVERFFVVAGVIFDADPGSIGKLLGTDEVFAPDFQTIDAQLLRRL